jgi:hypothetical protein
MMETARRGLCDWQKWVSDLPHAKGLSDAGGDVSCAISARDPGRDPTKDPNSRRAPATCR